MSRILRGVLFVAVLAIGIGGRPVEAQSGRQVYAYYFGWWTTDSWNNGLLIDRPAAPYASTDGGALGRHIDQAKGAGVDAFVMSWFGPKSGNLTFSVFNMLLDQAAARGFSAAASVDMYEAGYNANTGEVLESLRYLIGDRVNHPAYLRYNGKPVIYFWNQGRFSVGEWANMRSQVDPNHGTIWVMEGTSTAYLKVFDGLYLFNTAWSRNPASTAASWMRRTKAAGGTFYTPTVMPGWDESRIPGRTNPTAPQARARGAFLTNSWNGAAASGANAILIVSWNEYFENSHIEPSQAFGSQSLDVLRPLIAAWKGGRPVVQANSGGQPNTSGGQVLTVNVSTLKVRSGPGANFDQIGEVHLGETYPVLGRANGWYMISINGQNGYVSSAFVTVKRQ